MCCSTMLLLFSLNISYTVLTFFCLLWLHYVQLDFRGRKQLSNTSCLITAVEDPQETSQEKRNENIDNESVCTVNLKCGSLTETEKFYLGGI